MFFGLPFQNLFWQSAVYLRDSSFVWTPILLGYLMVRLYLEYIRARWIKNLQWVFLEIKIPKIISKSPRAMEVFLEALSQTGSTAVWELYWQGRVRPWFSLELVSLHGQIHFIVRAEKKYKNLLEAQIYSQYPEVEVFEVDDYTKEVPYYSNRAGWDLFGTEFKLDKADAYPIKTYVDYGLDKDPKEEFKVDPLTPLLEFLGSIGRGEFFWCQILVKAITSRDARGQKKDRWFKHETWQEEGRALIDELMKRKERPADAAAGFTLTIKSPGETKILESIERNLAKTNFYCGLRVIYLAEKDRFNPGNIQRLLSSFKQFGSAHLNSLKLNLKMLTGGLDNPWQDFKGLRLRYRKYRLFDAYVRRSYFYSPYKRKPFVLSTEELATIFHLPGEVAVTPTLSRIESRKSEPPINLPI